MILKKLTARNSRNILIAAAVMLAFGQTPLPAAAPQWGKTVNGLQTRLILAETSVLEGKAVHGILDVRNVANSPIKVTFCIAMSGLTEVSPVRSGGQLGAPLKPKQQVAPSSSAITLQPNMQTNVWNVRLDREFNLAKPGSYRISWPEIAPRYTAKGRPPPPSNSVTLEITSKNKPKPKPRPAVKIGRDPASKLTAILPKDWSLRSRGRDKYDFLHPGRQWSQVSASYMELRSPLVSTKDGPQRAAAPIVVWVTKQQAEKVSWRPTEKHQDIEQKTTEYLGGGPQHHVYLHLPTAAIKLWPTARRDIAKTLGIKLSTATQPASPAEPGDEGSEVTVTLQGDKVAYAVNSVNCPDIQAVKQALAKIPDKDAPLVIKIETKVPYKRVAEIMGIARKLRMTKISFAVIRTSTPPPPKSTVKPLDL